MPHVGRSFKGNGVRYVLAKHPRHKQCVVLHQVEDDTWRQCLGTKFYRCGRKLPCFMFSKEVEFSNQCMIAYKLEIDGQMQFVAPLKCANHCINCGKTTNGVYAPRRNTSGAILPRRTFDSTDLEEETERYMRSVMLQWFKSQPVPMPDGLEEMTLDDMLTSSVDFIEEHYDALKPVDNVSSLYNDYLAEEIPPGARVRLDCNLGVRNNKRRPPANNRATASEAPDAKRVKTEAVEVPPPLQLVEPTLTLEEEEVPRAFTLSLPLPQGGRRSAGVEVTALPLFIPTSAVEYRPFSLVAAAPMPSTSGKPTRRASVSPWQKAVRALLGEPSAPVACCVGESQPLVVMQTNSSQDSHFTSLGSGQEDMKAEAHSGADVPEEGGAETTNEARPMLPVEGAPYMQLDMTHLLLLAHAMMLRRPETHELHAFVEDPSTMPPTSEPVATTTEADCPPAPV